MELTVLTSAGCADCDRACMKSAGPIHPRDKKPVGVSQHLLDYPSDHVLILSLVLQARLARAAASVVYGKAGAFTGPTITGCTVSTDKKSVIVKFNTTLLADDKLIVQDYSKVSCHWYCVCAHTQVAVEVELVCGM